MRPLAMVIFMIYQKKKSLSACPQQMYRDGKDERSVASQAVQITCAQKAISAVWSASSSSFYKMLVHHVKGDLATQYNVDVVVRQQLPRKQVVRKGTFTCVFWSSVSANRQDAKKKKKQNTRRKLSSSSSLVASPFVSSSSFILHKRRVEEEQEVENHLLISTRIQQMYDDTSAQRF